MCRPVAPHKPEPVNDWRAADRIHDKQGRRWVRTPRKESWPDAMIAALLASPRIDAGDDADDRFLFA